MLGGECPFLSGSLGAAYARGLQSVRAPSPAAGEQYVMVNTVAKHLAVYGGPEGDYGDRSDTMPGMVDARYNATVAVEERLWREYYLPAWRAVAAEGGASGFMASYSALRLSDMTPATAARLAALSIAPGTAIPDSANPLLLTDEVRGAWAVPGYITSDAGSVLCTATCRQSSNGGMRGHRFAANESDAAIRALTAGLDLEISCCGLNFTFATLPASVRAGAVAEGLLDRALARTLPYRFQGASLDPAQDPWRALGPADQDTPAFRALALEAAQQGTVLLKNQALLPSNALGAGAAAATPVLPLDPAALAGRTVAVVGPNANDTLAQMGSYGNAAWPAVSTVWTALRDALPQTTVALLQDPLCPNVTHCTGFSPATVTAAAAADVVVAVLGVSAAINGYTCAAGEDYNEKEECDRRAAALPAPQLALLKALAAALAGKPAVPLVAVLVNGGALEVDWLAASPAVPAIVHVPYLGLAGGTAVAGVITGAVNPAGRLTATWYTAAGLAAIGDITDYRMRADTASGYPGRTYRYIPPAAAASAVQYPFGFGLSFGPTVVTYSDGTVAPAAPAPCDNVTVSVLLTNAGDAASVEVAQLYLSQPAAAVPAPLSALVAFERVRVPARSSVRVSFVVPPRLNALLRAGDLVEEVQPGLRALWAGGCSDAARLPGLALQFDTTGPPTPLVQCYA